MASARGEDRFPLLFVVNMGTDPLEKPPVEPPFSIRDRNVTRGAATVISRWPQHVQASSRLAFFTAFTIMCMSFFIVAVIFYTSDISVRFGGGEDDRHQPSRRLAMCNIDKNQVFENIHEGADVDALVKYMSPLSRAWEFFSDEDKIFFLMSQGDSLSPAKRCAIESAVNANSNSTIFLLVLLDKPKNLLDNSEHMEYAEEETAFNNSVNVVYVDVVKYLTNTPLEGFWQEGASNKDFNILAAKLVTLWRFGGLSLDVNVLSLKEAKLPRRKNKNACVDLAGYVMSVRHPCHSFMFQAMKVLEKMQQEEVLGFSRGYNPGNVITVAKNAYCKQTHCRKRLGIGLKCQGIKILPQEVVCRADHQPDNNKCTWASFTDQDVGKKYFKDICSFSSTLQENQSVIHVK